MTTNATVIMFRAIVHPRSRHVNPEVALGELSSFSVVALVGSQVGLGCCCGESVLVVAFVVVVGASVVELLDVVVGRTVGRRLGTTLGCVDGAAVTFAELVVGASIIVSRVVGGSVTTSTCTGIFGAAVMGRAVGMNVGALVGGSTGAGVVGVITGAAVTGAAVTGVGIGAAVATGTGIGGAVATGTGPPSTAEPDKVVKPLS